MAVDTAGKRASAVQVLRSWQAILPYPPDGAIGQGDRQHAAWTYSGILAGAAAITPLGRTYGIPGEMRVCVIEFEGRVLVIPLESRILAVESS